MDVHSKISSLKKELLRKTEKAVNEGDIKTLGIYAQRLQKLESLRNNLEKIETALGDIEGNIDSSENIAGKNSFASPNLLRGEREDTLSHKQRSENHRKSFVQECHSMGIKLYPYAGKRLFKLNSNGLVGITFSIEHPNGWFLGLPIKEYHALVLMCEKGEDILNFILPNSFFSNFMNNFSRTIKELKFHIMWQHGEYYLRIPKNGNKSIASYLDNFSCLSNIGDLSQNNDMGDFRKDNTLPVALSDTLAVIRLVKREGYELSEAFKAQDRIRKVFIGTVRSGVVEHSKKRKLEKFKSYLYSDSLDQMEDYLCNRFPKYKEKIKKELSDYK